MIIVDGDCSIALVFSVLKLTIPRQYKIHILLCFFYVEVSDKECFLKAQVPLQIAHVVIKQFTKGKGSKFPNFENDLCAKK